MEKILTNKGEKDWKDRILDYLFKRDIYHAPSEDIVDIEELRKKELKDKMISHIIGDYPETDLLKLIYTYAPPPKPTKATDILCKRIAKRFKELDALSLDELEKFLLSISDRRTHEHALG